MPTSYFKFSDLSNGKSLFSQFGIILTLLPGTILIAYEMVSDIRGPNPFIAVFIILFGVIALGIGLFIYWVNDNRYRRRFKWTLAIIIFQLMVLPIVWGIQKIKYRLFIHQNKPGLELVAKKILSKEWGSKEAIDQLKTIGLPIYYVEKMEQDSIILFYISGMVDNMVGLAFSPTEINRGKDAGGTITWNRIIKHWYRFYTR